MVRKIRLKKYYKLVSFVLLAILPACSLTTRIQPALAALKATPTPVLTTLGIPGSQLLQHYLDQGFQIDRNQGVVGQNRIVAKSPDSSILLNISTFQGEVTNATIWLPVDPKNILSPTYKQDLTSFLDLLLPNWSGRGTWLQQSLEAAATSFSQGKGEYYTIDDTPNASVELTASTSTQQIILLVFAKQQSND